MYLFRQQFLSVNDSKHPLMNVETVDFKVKLKISLEVLKLQGDEFPEIGEFLH